MINGNRTRVEQLTMQGWSASEIGKELGISANTVYSHRHSARQRQRDPMPETPIELREYWRFKQRKSEGLLWVGRLNVAHSGSTTNTQTTLGGSKVELLPTHNIEIPSWEAWRKDAEHREMMLEALRGLGFEAAFETFVGHILGRPDATPEQKHDALQRAARDAAH